MNLRIKPLYLSAALALALASCGSASKMVSTPVANIDKMPLKTSPLKGKRFTTLESFRFSERHGSWNEC